MDTNIIDEKHPSKVAGIFNSIATAKAAQAKLIKQGHFKAKDIKIVYPHDAGISQKIAPRDSGIATTLVNAHIIIGLGGLLFGLLLAFVLTLLGPDMFRSSPLLVYLALGFVGAMLGLMIAGGVSLRPDQDPLISDTVEASNENKWSVVVQIDDIESNERAQTIMQETAVSVSHSF